MIGPDGLGPLIALTCGHCGGKVEVAKSSAAQTSIQWSTDAMRRCRAFTVRDGCPHLRRTVESAVLEGALVIGND